MVTSILKEASAGSSRLREDEWDVVERLRNGDEAAFGALLDRYCPSLIRLIMRDVEGLSSKDVRDTLQISEANQRVLLLERGDGSDVPLINI